MNHKILKSFLEEEANAHVRKLLLRRISDCQTGAAIGCHKYEFNRFMVTIDCDAKEAVIEDDLTPGADGQGRWSLSEFGSALWSPENQAS